MERENTNKVLNFDSTSKKNIDRKLILLGTSFVLFTYQGDWSVVNLPSHSLNERSLFRV